MCYTQICPRFECRDEHTIHTCVGETRESWAMFYILYHSAEMKGRIPKLNDVSKTLEGLLALYNVTVGTIAQYIHRKGIEKNGKMVQLSLRRGELSHHCRRVVPP